MSATIGQFKDVLIEPFESLSIEIRESSLNVASRFTSAQTAPDFEADEPSYHLVVFENERPAARLSIWTTKEKAQDRRGNLGFIGHYAAISCDAGQKAIAAACRLLGELGAAQVVGPVDGSTWRRYRLITETQGRLPFFLEPDNPLEWAHHFEQSGFEVVRTYASSINDDLTREDKEAIEIEKHLCESGLSIRELSFSSQIDDLGALHSITNQAMKDNYLFRPIEKSAFIAGQQKLIPFVDRRFVLIAEQEGKIVGFLFAVPDHLDDGSETLVMKTIARKPDNSIKGLGRVLFETCHRRAREAGFKRAIHALFTTDNRAHAISRNSASTFRTYAVFGRAL